MMKKASNPEGQFILDWLNKNSRTPEWLAVNSNINKGALHNMIYKFKKPWQPAHTTLSLCSVMGISIEKFLTGNDTDLDRDTAYQKLQKINRELENKITEKDLEIKNLKKALNVFINGSEKLAKQK